ncbi:heat shock protein [Anaeramoeba flamelloides]|uniref:Heat shock protein n=1 Tax=Anaeramoeba flamelloides TaxID=1746091 RepID=A0AAV7ZEM3_9EUKA|nr:heat shock protein [Anaeramoeba flamelloides]
MKNTTFCVIFRPPSILVGYSSQPFTQIHSILGPKQFSDELELIIQRIKIEGSLSLYETIELGSKVREMWDQKKKLEEKINKNSMKQKKKKIQKEKEKEKEKEQEKEKEKEKEKEDYSINKKQINNKEFLILDLPKAFEECRKEVYTQEGKQLSLLWVLSSIFTYLYNKFRGHFPNKSSEEINQKTEFLVIVPPSFSFKQTHWIRKSLFLTGLIPRLKNHQKLRILYSTLPLSYLASTLIFGTKTARTQVKAMGSNEQSVLVIDLQYNSTEFFISKFECTKYGLLILSQKIAPNVTRPGISILINKLNQFLLNFLQLNSVTRLNYNLNSPMIIGQWEKIMSKIEFTKIMGTNKNHINNPKKNLNLKKFFLFAIPIELMKRQAQPIEKLIKFWNANNLYKIHFYNANEHSFKIKNKFIQKNNPNILLIEMQYILKIIHDSIKIIWRNVFSEIKNPKINYKLDHLFLTGNFSLSPYLKIYFRNKITSKLIVNNFYHKPSFLLSIYKNHEKEMIKASITFHMDKKVKTFLKFNHSFNILLLNKELLLKRKQNEKEIKGKGKDKKKKMETEWKRKWNKKKKKERKRKKKWEKKKKKKKKKKKDIETGTRSEMEKFSYSSFSHTHNNSTVQLYKELIPKNKLITNGFFSDRLINYNYKKNLSNKFLKINIYSSFQINHSQYQNQISSDKSNDTFFRKESSRKIKIPVEQLNQIIEHKPTTKTQLVPMIVSCVIQDAELKIKLFNQSKSIEFGKIQHSKRKKTKKMSKKLTSNKNKNKNNINNKNDQLTKKKKSKIKKKESDKTGRRKGNKKAMKKEKKIENYQNIKLFFFFFFFCLGCFL